MCSNIINLLVNIAFNNVNDFEINSAWLCIIKPNISESSVITKYRYIQIMQVLILKLCTKLSMWHKIKYTTMKFSSFEFKNTFL